MYERNDVIRQFEKTISKHCGSPFGIAVESCCSALLLCCLYHKVKDVYIPKCTYHGVPCAIRNAGGMVRWTHEEWTGSYRLSPYPIIDSACRFKKGMYEKGTFCCLSFQYAKHIPIGRGGMILTDDLGASMWLRKMRNDGRMEIPKEKDNVKLIGYNMYMTPEQAARGLSLYYWRIHGKPDLPDLDMNYMDLSTLKRVNYGRFMDGEC